MFPVIGSAPGMTNKLAPTGKQDHRPNARTVAAMAERERVGSRSGKVREMRKRVAAERVSLAAAAELAALNESRRGIRRGRGDLLLYHAVGACGKSQRGRA